MLDWERLDELRVEIGEEDFAEVAEVFLEELDDVISKLKDGGSANETTERLHFLKGCALNLGFATMASLASEGHRLARSGNQAEIDLLSLFEAYNTSRLEFEARFGDATAA